jgi:hypothetical protein
MGMRGWKSQVLLDLSLILTTGGLLVSLEGFWCLLSWVGASRCFNVIERLEQMGVASKDKPGKYLGGRWTQ